MQRTLEIGLCVLFGPNCRSLLLSLAVVYFRITLLRAWRSQTRLTWSGSGTRSGLAFRMLFGVTLHSSLVFSVAIRLYNCRNSSDPKILSGEFSGQL